MRYGDIADRPDYVLARLFDSGLTDKRELVALARTFGTWFDGGVSYRQLARHVWVCRRIESGNPYGFKREGTRRLRMLPCACCGHTGKVRADVYREGDSWRVGDYGCGYCGAC